MLKSQWLLAFVFVTSLIMTADQAAAGEGKTKKVSLASMSISGSFPETSTQVGLFGDMQPNLMATIQRIDKAGKDKKVSGIVLRIRSPQIGRGKVDELRAAIARARKNGTKVYADITSAQGVDYLIATACDEIVMPPSGSLLLPGVRAEVMFYSGLLKKLGVKADFIQIGEFKGAAEPFTRTKMSPAFRGQYESLIDDVYEQMVTKIALARGLDHSKVRKLIDEGMFSASQAKKAGLIDHVLYEDEFRDMFRKELEADKLAVIRNYGKKKLNNDLSGFGGMMQLMQMMMGKEEKENKGVKSKIAVVYAVGAIMNGESSQGIFGGQSLGGDTIVAALRKASKDKKVKAIVLRVDSPGGAALASDLIWREVERIDKPVIASMGDVAASGGYYISMGADKIFAEPGTLTGSIGVVGGKMALRGLYGKVGLTVDVISRGKNSGTFSTTDGFSDSERAAMKRLMLDTYEQFTSKAAAGRKMDIKQLKSLAAGRVFTGRQAKANGLVDELGTLRDAINAAKKMAKLGEDDKAELMILPRPKSFFEQMMGGQTVETHMGKQIQQALPQLTQGAQELLQLDELFKQRAVTILPYRVEIK